MATNKEQYSKMAEKASPNSPVLKNCLNAFWVGGLICVLGQALRVLYEYLGLNKDEVGALVPATIIVLTAILTGAGIFDKIAKFAGAGTIVPITGFANSVVSPAIEYKSEGSILGTASNIFKIAGPVIVYSNLAAVIYGVIAWIFKLY
ncbi:hypothetical protein SDC9_121320 [bioreactor metagenome]|uniref:Stage V sporulation protein AC n=1 Tax=bioreactor metagenome TaxID=1076179 RepID=A0A645CBM4_9ZZZZ